MKKSNPPTLSPSALTHWHNVAPLAAPWLHDEVADRMVQRLQYITLQPKKWLHWQPVQGGLAVHMALCRKYPTSDAVFLQNDKHNAHASKSIAAMLCQKSHQTSFFKHQVGVVKKWLADRKTPVPPSTAIFSPLNPAADMLWCNMQLHHTHEPMALLKQWHDALAVDGFLMFSCLGPDTCIELRNMYKKMGWGEATQAFTDMHDWGDMLIEADFADPIMDVERLVLTYSTPDALLADLRSMGRNFHHNRFAGLRGKTWKMALDTALAAELTNPQTQRLQLTFEIIYGHAIKPKPRLKMSEHSAISLQDMRAMLGR